VGRGFALFHFAERVSYRGHSSSSMLHCLAVVVCCSPLTCPEHSHCSASLTSCECDCGYYGTEQPAAGRPEEFMRVCSCDAQPAEVFASVFWCGCTGPSCTLYVETIPLNITPLSGVVTGSTVGVVNWLSGFPSGERMYSFYIPTTVCAAVLLRLITHAHMTRTGTSSRSRVAVLFATFASLASGHSHSYCGLIDTSGHRNSVHSEPVHAGN
jgi:hypothetical protein